LFPIASPSIICTAKKWGLPVIVTLHNYRLLCPSATLFHNGQLYLKSLRLSFPWGAVFKGVYRNSVIETAALAFVTTVHRLFSTWQQKVDLYICLTHFAKKIHIESSLSIPQHKLVVKPNSVADYGNGITNRSDFYLFVGRLTEEKGIRTLLHAASLFNFELIMMGQGPLENEVTEFAQDYSNIHYLGFQDKESVLRYLKMCRALVMPSLWYEGLPVTLLEAFSTGTVVIASNLGALAEIIQDGVNGLLFEAGNSKELANTIAAIAENKYDMGRIRENARSTYLRHYTPDKNYHSLVNIYNKAIGMNEQAPVVLA
jgi:glycosyltransferase involved in cell wall biosynthesis